MALKYTSTMLAKGEGFLQLSENIFEVEHSDFFIGQIFFFTSPKNQRKSFPNSRTIYSNCEIEQI